ncbi:MAG: F0F1 ATP synthase subunit alpha [Nitrospira sp.]|nr:F0F1 ATP synthase subunit alpha [Nitrospira sp.]
MAAERSAAESVLERRAAWLRTYRFELRVVEQGTVVSVGDGIAWIEGLPSAAMDDVLDFEDGSRGLVVVLARRQVGVILLHATAGLTAGTAVQVSKRTLTIPVGDALLGRVIDPLGNPLDGLDWPDCHASRPLDVLSPSIAERDRVRKPLYTGNKVVDTLIPIGKGQRQLIIGDNGLGKSSLAIDTVMNQRGKDVLCVYTLIGQKRTTVVNTIEMLRRFGAIDHTVVVVAEATALPGLTFLAPFAGCAVAEAWMRRGKDSLVVYDDLTTHAQAYRELSLLLRRPPGREAYPGDIFYLHARLLERSTCLVANGGGSMTALPIVETKEGDIASYIPTNLISITDGQIYVDRRLFTAGIMPAIDVTKSVSRVGGKSQHPRIKEKAGRVKLDFLQFLELEAFTRFGTKLEASMEAKIARGRVLRELLKQDRLSPLSIEGNLAWLIAYNLGLFDTVPKDRLPGLMEGLAAKVSASGLTLDDGEERWRQSVTAWCEEWTAHEQTAGA